MKRFIKSVNERYSKNLTDYEYSKISKCLRDVKDSSFTLLDVGSGLCGFVSYAKTEFRNAEIQAVDINPDLVEHAVKLNINCQQASVVKLPFNENCFDVVHCSHVLEHLRYPDVIIAINELFRVAKFGGRVIIRSPLVASNGFWDDIDHVRPYPPNAILNYFNITQQQQRISYCSYKIKCMWYLRGAFLLDTNFVQNSLVQGMNLVSKLSWNVFRFPFSRAYNYGMVLEKELPVSSRHSPGF